MPTPLALEMYLNKLDRSLGYLPVSEKAEIVTAIKNQVLQKMAQDPNQKVDSILTSLGSPQNVANRMLLERGHKPAGNRGAPLVKWLALGLVGAVALICITTLVLAWKFSPVFEVSNGKVKFFGGTVDLDEDIAWNLPDDFNVDAYIQESDDKNYFQNAFSGTHDVLKKELKEIHLVYKNASIFINSAEENKFEWKCITSGTPNSTEGTVESGVFKLDLNPTAAAKCKLTVPKNIRVFIRGHYGALSLTKPSFPVNVEILNASVKISPNPDLKYHFDLKTENGKVDDFISHESPDAIEIKVSIKNGAISSF